MFMVSATVNNFWGFRPFWVRKMSEISPKMASIACYWASKWTQICPEFPQNDSQTPQQYSIVVVSTTVNYLGAFMSFLGNENGVARQKFLILITDIAWFFNFE